MRIELSGFADEINPLMDVQLRVLNDLGIRFIELRGVDGNNITSLTLEETEALKKTACSVSTTRMKKSAMRCSAVWIFS